MGASPTTAAPTNVPTLSPTTASPTRAPTPPPVVPPTSIPTRLPTSIPTRAPTIPQVTSSFAVELTGNSNLVSLDADQRETFETEIENIALNDSDMQGAQATVTDQQLLTTSSTARRQLQTSGN